MDYEEPLRKAARSADQAVAAATRMYRDGSVAHEEEITGALVGALEVKLKGKIGGLIWSCHILTHKGPKTEESAVGADLLIHVSLSTPTLNYSKGVLIQTKRVEPGENMPERSHRELKDQCRRMLRVSSHAWVFDYSKVAMRCGPAVAIVGSNNRDLYGQCVWTSYRFFLELFRCPVGDFAITSAHVKDLPLTPTAVELKGEFVG